MDSHDYSFGATSAVMTGLAIIIGFSSTADAKTNIITALLVIAIADNISDTFGIHMHQESQASSSKEVRRTTIYNFLSRLVVTGAFILLVLALPIFLSVWVSVLLGIVVILFVSYAIAKRRKESPWRAARGHLALAIAVMVASFFLRSLLARFAVKA